MRPTTVLGTPMKPIFIVLSHLTIHPVNINVWQALAGFAVSSTLSFSIQKLRRRPANKQDVYFINVSQINVYIELGAHTHSSVVSFIEIDKVNIDKAVTKVFQEIESL